MADTTAIVIDNGTGTIKAGIAGDDAPRSVFPCIVGKPKMPGILVGLDHKEDYIGDEVKEKKGVLKLEYPIERRIIKDWENMERIWNYTIYQELKLNPEEQAVVLSEPPLNPKENREKITRLMFEALKVPCLFIVSQPVLALYSSGKTTGLIVDIGEGASDTVPIYDGLAIPHAIPRIPLGGRDLTIFLQDLLKKQSHSTLLNAVDELENAQWLKERLCQVALEYPLVLKEAAESKSIEKKEILPDGNIITLGIERYQVPEILFQPQIIGKEFEGIHKYIDESIKKCNQSMRKELYNSIILSGGSTMFQFMSGRIKNEIKKLTPSDMEVTIMAAAERKYGVWIGGSILASLSTFPAMYITRNEYSEAGP